MSKLLQCCIVGHRKVNERDELVKRIETAIEDMVENKGVSYFLFGSKSEFNDLCHGVVTALKEKKYPQIKRIVYTCKHETFVSETEREDLEKLQQKITNKAVKLLGYESEREHKTKYRAGKASYVERNQAMIDDSDFCLFYYRDGESSVKSGTEIAYRYAEQKKKPIVNLAETHDRQ